jgi:hypothetical protein
VQSEVLELNGGYTRRHHVKEGDIIKFDRWFFRPSIAELIDKAKNALRFARAQIITKPLTPTD